MKNSTKIFKLFKIALILFLLQAILQLVLFLINDQIIWAYQKMVGTYNAGWGSILYYIVFVVFSIPYFIVFIITAFFTKINHFILNFILHILIFLFFTEMKILAMLYIPAIILTSIIVYLLLKNTRFNQNNSEEN